MDTFRWPEQEQSAYKALSMSGPPAAARDAKRSFHTVRVVRQRNNSIAVLRQQS